MSPTFVAPDQVIEALQWRYATKSFDPNRKIPAETWAAIEQSLVLTPSSFGMQPWKFFVVTHDGIRQQLLEHSWKQRQVVDASHLVILAIKKMWMRKRSIAICTPPPKFVKPPLSP